MGGRPENPTGGMPWYPPGLVNCSPPALFLLLLDPCLENGFQSKLMQIKKSLARYSSNVCSVTVHVGN
jgi:hypothetical protein